jgi:hypothetical protein
MHMLYLSNLIEFLHNLEKNKIYFWLNYANDAVLVEITTPRKKWEARFAPDGGIEVEKFLSDGEILVGEKALDELLEKSMKNGKKREN